jgi:hypothetical protein
LSTLYHNCRARVYDRSVYRTCHKYVCTLKTRSSGVDALGCYPRLRNNVRNPSMVSDNSVARVFVFCVLCLVKMIAYPTTTRCNAGISDKASCSRSST